MINSTVGTDLGVGGFKVHPVLGGDSVPSGEDSGGLELQHDSAGHPPSGKANSESKHRLASAKHFKSVGHLKITAQPCALHVLVVEYGYNFLCRNLWNAHF